MKPLAQMLFRSLCGCALIGLGFLPARAETLTISPGVPIYLGAAEPEPIQRAARDLARDFRSVFGADSPIRHEAPPTAGTPFIEIIGPGARAEARRDAKPGITGHEAHGVFALQDRNGSRVILQGADMRGTIYAIYTFSEKFLGVKPLWFWASQPPRPKASIEVPSETSLLFGPPSVYWRAWFPNDTDLFDPWKERSPENYDALYEAMLRLKLNCLEGHIADKRSFEPPYPLGRESETARQRGLAFVGHHVYPLGSSYGDWQDFWKKTMRQPPPKLSVKNTDALETFWRWHAELAKRHGLEEIWLIGFRGRTDQPFWETFADSPRVDRERAAVIAEMMRREVGVVKAVTGESAPVMRTTLYNELSNFYAAGLLKPPSEPNLIWTFVAARRDHFPAPDAQNAHVPPGQPVGYYMNFQFTSTGAHLAQAEGPWKMERNFRFINGITPRPLELSVVNMGNIREFLLEGSAQAAMMWDFKTYDSDKFLADFCRQYFGADHASEVAALYREFFDSYWRQRHPALPGFERQFIFQDLRLSRAMRLLTAALRKPGKAPAEDFLRDKDNTADGSVYNIVPADSGAPNRLAAFIVGTTSTTEKLEKIVTRGEALRTQLPKESRTFFDDNLLSQARLMLAVNRTAGQLAQAVAAEGNHAKRAEHVRAAQAAVMGMTEAAAQAEHGVFAGWYASDRLFGMKAHRTDIEALKP